MKMIDALYTRLKVCFPGLVKLESYTQLHEKVCRVVAYGSVMKSSNLTFLT